MMEEFVAHMMHVFYAFKEASDVNARLGMIVGGILFVVAAAGMGTYELQKVSVKTGTITYCTASEHKGSKEVAELSDVKTILVPRHTADQYKVETKTVAACSICQTRIAEAKRKADEEAARQRLAAERQRREDEEMARIVAITSTLRGRIIITYNGMVTGSLRPGEPVILTVVLWNEGSRPISGLKVYIESGDLHLKIDRAEDLGFVSPDYPKHVREWKKVYQLLTTSGLPIGQTLNPANSPYYAHDQYQWPDVGWNGGIHLSKNTVPGTDVRIYCGAVVEGHRVILGSALIHVMH